MAKQAVQEYFAGLERCSFEEKEQRVTWLCYDLMTDTIKFFEAVVAGNGFETFRRYHFELSEALSNLHRFNRGVMGLYLPHDRTGARLALRDFGCSVATLGLEMKYHESSVAGARFSPGNIQEVGAALQLLGIGIVKIANNGYSPSENAVGIAAAKNGSLRFLDDVVNKLAAGAILAPLAPAFGGLHHK